MNENLNSSPYTLTRTPALCLCLQRPQNLCPVPTPTPGWVQDSGARSCYTALTALPMPHSRSTVPEVLLVLLGYSHWPTAGNSSLRCPGMPPPEQAAARQRPKGRAGQAGGLLRQVCSALRLSLGLARWPPFPSSEPPHNFLQAQVKNKHRRHFPCRPAFSLQTAAVCSLRPESPCHRRQRNSLASDG